MCTNWIHELKIDCVAHSKNSQAQIYGFCEKQATTIRQMNTWIFKGFSIIIFCYRSLTFSWLIFLFILLDDTRIFIL